MQEFKAYAAIRPNGPLEPFSFNPGPIGPEEVEIKVTHCGLCHSDLSVINGDRPRPTPRRSARLPP